MSEGRCSHCRANRPLDELLAVIDRRRPWRRRLICRPRELRHCFRDSVAGAADERIEAADIDPAPSGALTVGGDQP